MTEAREAHFKMEGNVINKTMNVCARVFICDVLILVLKQLKKKQPVE